jgi:CubicO group peptidase (beta-lactamase class C family)
MPSEPQALGLSSERLRRIDRFIENHYIDAGRLHGAVVLVARRGEVAHLGVLGMMDAERRRPMAPDTIFRLYSMTKPLTSVAFMMLVEEGLVALDDPVSRFIPEWGDLGVYDRGFPEAFRVKPPGRPMLVVDLLRHTSGLTYGFQQRTGVDAAYRRLRLDELAGPVDLEHLIAALAGLPLEFSPGEAWNYSVSTDVLGYLIGRISGSPFEDFLQSRVLDPLGMMDTGFTVPADKADRFAACYMVGRDGLALQDDPRTSPFLCAPTLVSGGGGLVSTANDYLRFCRMVLNGGELDGRRLLSPKTVELMGRNHLPGGRDLASLSRSMFSEASYAGLGFGLGFATTVDPALTLIPSTIGDLAWGGAASTYFWIDPREALIVILMTQLLPSTAYPIRRQLRTLVYSAFTETNR